ncbi:hypothetical protein F2P81_014342 [Scophthalmus maximus]|uniref:Uncharacterized protein n=1 Tax=Scophthalmus maximus TaxID=52904 RepID=A0A6A4SGK3_SCOMX|nr:hypothetical protein F2P81_014342 [Scophthalmus maximus]
MCPISTRRSSDFQLISCFQTKPNHEHFNEDGRSFLRSSSKWATNFAQVARLSVVFLFVFSLCRNTVTGQDFITIPRNVTRRLFRLHRHVIVINSHVLLPFACVPS